MANIRERKNKSGTSYKVEVRLKGYPKKYATFARKSDAVRWGEDVEYCLQHNLPLPGEELPLDDMSIEKAVEKYLALVEKMPGRSRHTILTDRGTAGRLIGRFGRFSLRGLCREDIEEYRADRLTEVGPSSVRHDMSMLSRVYDTARVRWRFKDLDYPGRDVKLPSPPPNRKVILSEAQIPRLMEECRKSKNSMLAPLVQLLLETGMRPEEAVLLRCYSVDLDNNGIIDLSKTKTDPRRVPISNNCIKLLRGLMKPKGNADLIFIDEDRAKKDKPVRFFRRAFEQAAIRAGINRPLSRDVSKKKAETLPEQPSSGRVTLYTLRHSAATYLLMNGVDIRTVADILGHSNLSQTMRYTHMADGHKRAAVNNPDLPWNK